MAEEPEIPEIQNIEPDATPGYRPPAKKTLEEIKSMDPDDQSLVNYKKALLCEDGASPEDDDRKVIVEQMSFVVDGRDDIVFDLTGENLKKMKMVVKEGAEYKIRLGFKIHHEIVAGLRYHHVIKRKGVNADKQTYMVGSYGPKKDMQTWLSPVDEAPKGLIYRGTYTLHSKFIDDDNVVHLEWEWEMDIKKDWQ